MLNNVDINNLLVFLNRATLKGDEVSTFVELYQKLQKMREVTGIEQPDGGNDKK